MFTGKTQEKKPLVLFLVLSIIFSSIMVLGPTIAFAATTIHVSINGSDTSGNGSQSSPYRTIQKGVDMAQAGDTVLVHAGDYSSASVTTARAGTSGSRITIQAASGETVTAGRFYINHNYITVKGFRITNFPTNDWLIQVTGSNFEFLDNYLYSNKSTDYYSARGLKLDCDYAVVRGCTFDGMSNRNVYAKQSTIFICISSNTGSNQTFENNVFKNMVDCERIFEVYINNVTYRNNEMYNIWAWNGSEYGDIAHVDIWQNFNWYNEYKYSYNILAENNYAHDMVAQIGCLEAQGGSWIMRNNIFANLTGSSSLFNNNQDMNIYNNTFYNVGETHPLALTYGVNTSVVKNNIFYACGRSMTDGGWYGITGSSTASNNYVALSGNLASPGFSGENGTGVNGGNPYFVNAGTNRLATDFQIQSGSVCINKGTTLSGFNTDYLGNTRTGTWDIGAFEYGATGGATPTPTPAPTSTPTPAPGAWYMQLNDWAGATHSLGTSNTGTVTTEFNVTIASNLSGVMDSDIGYADSSANPTAMTNLGPIIELGLDGRFTAMNGTAYAAVTTVPYSAGNTYHVKMVANVTAKTYDVWVTPPGGSQTKITNNYAFRSNCTPVIDDIGKLSFVTGTSGADEKAYITNHTVSTGATPTPTPANMLANPGFESGRGCLGWLREQVGADQTDAYNTAIGQDGSWYGYIQYYNSGYAACYQSFSLSPGTYTFSCKTRCYNGASVRLLAYDETYGALLKSNTVNQSSWMANTLVFTVTSTTQINVGFDIEGCGTNSSYYSVFDTCSLIKN